MLALCACGTSRTKDIPQGAAALAEFPPAPAATAPLAAYRLGPLDELSVNVFREPDLSVERAVVDLAGNINLPLVGPVRAVGRTAEEIDGELEQRLNARYLRDARVSVAVTKATSYTFTIEGEVRQPGTYAIPGRLTLLQAVAAGGGVTERARLSEVIVFRTVEGKRYAARFDLRDVRAGLMADPELQVGDVVVVNFSAGQQLYRDLLQVAPGLGGIFIALANNNN